MSIEDLDKDLLQMTNCQTDLPVVPCVERGVTGAAPVASGKLLGVTVDVQARGMTSPFAVHFQHLIIPENMNDFKIPHEIRNFEIIYKIELVKY